LVTEESEEIKMQYPTINMRLTGQNIKQIMLQKGLSMNEIKDFLGLGSTQAMYHWFHGKSLPSVDNLYALSILFEMPIDEILIGNTNEHIFYQIASNRRILLYYKKLAQLKAC
jgi:transcriptional regulator with XRE-family HTH domain